LVYSENQIEVEAHVPVIISEELTILRVGSAGMYFKRVEMVRKVYLEFSLTSFATRASAEK
jgi:hypothetical protein